MEWQPIETAPKDGTKIILGRFVKNCQEGRSPHVEIDFWHRLPVVGYEGFGKFNDKYWPPTHWMPLPAPPSNAGNERTPLAGGPLD